MTRYLLIFLAACLALTASPLAWSAPHISGKPEPLISKPGLPFHQRALAQNRAKALAPATYPATVKVLFLRVDFPADNDATTTGTGVWTDPLYAHHSDADYWINKNRLAMISYYAEVSYRKLTLDITISPAIYRLPKTMTQYGDETPAHLESLIFDSVTAADSGTDFTAYDAIMIIHAGAGEETDISNDTPNDIWSLHYADAAINSNNSTPTPLIADGASITEALIMSQTGTQDGGTVDPLGIYAHEFGHWLGLPDLYVTSPAPDWDGIGAWGLMGGGIYAKGADGVTGSAPAHLEAWSKVYLKWAVPRTFATDTDPGMQTLAAVETNATVFKLPASSTTPTQYYLLENRRKTGINAGFDSGLPGEGLLVWLVDELAIATGIPNNTVNNNRARPGITLIEADGDNALHTFGGGDDGSSGDPFPGQTGNAHFTPRTVPAAVPSDGNAWVYIKNISVDALDNVVFTLEFSPAAPTNITATLNGTGTSLQWNAPSATDLALYSVYKNGVLLRTVNLPAYSDSSVAAGDTYHVTATDTNGNESARSLQITPIPAIIPQKDKRCFIATAAYGSYQAPYVSLLREFRDDYLLTHAFGTALVNFYYAVSPPIAQFIAQHESIKAMVRVSLLPCIALAFFFVKLGASGKLLVVILGIAIGLAGHQGLKKSRHKIRVMRQGGSLTAASDAQQKSG